MDLNTSSPEESTLMIDTDSEIEENHECGICGNKFMTSTSLRIHTKKCVKSIETRSDMTEKKSDSGLEPSEEHSNIHILEPQKQNELPITEEPLEKDQPPKIIPIVSNKVNPISSMSLKELLRIFKCGICKKAFEDHRSVNEHMKEEHNDESNNKSRPVILQAKHQCDICLNEFEQLSQLLEDSQPKHKPMSHQPHPKVICPLC